LRGSSCDKEINDYSLTESVDGKKEINDHSIREGLDVT